MRAELSSIELGSRVVYAVGGVEHNAIALGAPSEGYNQGIRLATISLNLIYLNLLGVPVKIVAAPLLGVAADEDHLAEVAKVAAEKTQGYHTSPPDVKEAMAADHLEHIKAHPRTYGWRPYVEGEEAAALKAQVAVQAQQIADLETHVTALMEPSTSMSDIVPALALLSKPEVAAYVTAPENQDELEAALKKGRGTADEDGSGEQAAEAAEEAAEAAGSLEEVYSTEDEGDTDGPTKLEEGESLLAIPEAPADAPPAPIENPEAATDAEQEADKAAQSQAAETGE
jgi:hypothetical protein